MASESLGCDTFEWNPVKPYYFSPFGELQLLGWFFLEQVSHSFRAERGQENPIKTSGWDL